MKKTIQVISLITIIGLLIGNASFENTKFSPNLTISNLFNQAVANAEEPGTEGCTGATGRYCYNGGCTSSSCSIDAGIEILGFGITGAGSATAENINSFACCTMRCKSYSKTVYYESSNILDTDL